MLPFACVCAAFSGVCGWSCGHERRPLVRGGWEWEFGGDTAAAGGRGGRAVCQLAGEDGVRDRNSRRRCRARRSCCSVAWCLVSMLSHVGLWIVVLVRQIASRGCSWERGHRVAVAVQWRRPERSDGRKFWHPLSRRVHMANVLTIVSVGYLVAISFAWITRVGWSISHGHGQGRRNT